MNKFERFNGAERFFAACEKLKGKRVGILGHLRPDGDCLGAQIAMHSILSSYGAVPLIGFADDDILWNLRWLAQPFELVNLENVPADEYIFVDCGVQSRAGDFAKRLDNVAMSIDHHISGEQFAKETFFFPEAAATCEIIADFIDQKAWPISPVVATALYVGIVTDTGKFSYSSTTSRTLYLASRLALSGADPHQIFVDIYQNEPREKFALLQRFLASLKFYAKDSICIGNVTEQDYADTHTISEDTEGFVNFPRSITGVKIAVIAYEREGKTRVSVRTDDPSLRMDILASKFYGGGHACASAFTVNENYDKFEKIFINALQVHLNSFSVNRE